MDPKPSEPPDLDLLALTGVIIEVSADDREAVATLAPLIRSGQVRVVER
jgi:hypothetical protein